jgi:RND family efflux transporter MFP subunit
MMLKKLKKIELSLFLFVVPVLSASVLGQTYDWITAPSQDVVLGFVTPGRIGQVFVKQGDKVKQGETLAQLDDSAEQASTEQLKLQSESTINARYAQAQADQKRVDLDKFTELYDKGLVTQLEFRNATVEAKIAELRVELAKFDQQQAVLKFKEADLNLSRMTLKCPIDGLVEKIAAKEGESADRDGKIMRVVNIDPLYIDVPISRADASRLSLNHPAQVTFSDQAVKAAIGKVIFIAAVANSGSDTVTVRIELPNPSLRRAGEHVKIDFNFEPGKATTAPATATTSPSSKESNKE